MKKLFTTLIAVSLLSLFSCANSSSDSSSGLTFDDSVLQDGAIAVYEYKIDESESGMKINGITSIYFYEDSTFLIHMYGKTSMKAKSFSMNITQNYDFAKGTYTGDPTKDGTLQARMDEEIDKEAIDEEIAKLPLAAYYENSSSVSFTLTNKELPLKATGYTAFEEIEISNGEMYIPTEPTPYIRRK